VGPRDWSGGSGTPGHFGVALAGVAG
jgi:hypothetical protein